MIWVALTDRQCADLIRGHVSTAVRRHLEHARLDWTVHTKPELLTPQQRAWRGRHLRTATRRETR